MWRQKLKAFSENKFLLAEETVQELTDIESVLLQCAVLLTKMEATSPERYNVERVRKALHNVATLHAQTSDMKDIRLVTEVDNSCEMDIKEEHSLSDDVSQNKTEFFTMKRNSDDVLIKTEIPPKHFTKQIKCEAVTCSNNWEVDSKTEIEEQTLVSDFSSQNKAEFLPEIAVMNLGKYNNDHEICNKMEIKQEPCWLETEASSSCDDIKDGDLPEVTSSRLHTEAVSGDSSGNSPMSCAEGSGIDTSFYNGKDNLECGHQKSDVAEMPTTEEHVLPEHSDKYIDGGEMYIRPLYLNKKGLIHDQRSYKCNICAKGFKLMSHLKTHNLIHEGKKSHQCKICDKSFVRISTLRRHYSIHEGKKPHQCKTCDKTFSRLSHLKTHNLIHEGKKPHQCKICDKNFTQVANLKRHNLIHEGKKPHHCETCDKRFTLLSTLKTHNLIHEGKKPHQCKTCDKSFTQLSTLKKHNMIHEGRKSN